MRAKFSLGKFAFEYSFILVGSLLYAISTVLFVFPSGLVLGGTNGIAVILNGIFHQTPGTFSVILNASLILLAFIVLGREMATKTLVGSLLTTVFIGALERVFVLGAPIIENSYISAVVGGGIIAVASAIMFFVDSSSGGTDIIALIVKKFSNIKIGRALLITDVLIVIVGGLLSGLSIFIPSVIGLVIKTLGIDVVILLIKSAIGGASAAGAARKES
jgi:uncharacterized membrane-anchored protein YitT (DUF2179 family)